MLFFAGVATLPGPEGRMSHRSRTVKPAAANAAAEEGEGSREGTGRAPLSGLTAPGYASHGIAGGSSTGQRAHRPGSTQSTGVHLHRIP